MPDKRRATCRRCGNHASEVGPISWRGKCLSCGLEAERDAIYQLAEHRGPVFQHWRVRIAASVGGVIPDNTRTD